MKNRFLIWVFSLFVVNCYSQNLVRNHDFSETFDWQERNLKQGWYDHVDSIAPGWWSPTRGTPDFFCCSDIPKRKSSVPENVAGFSYPKSGLGYVGILVANRRLKHYKNGNFREYIQTELLKTLEKEKLYCIGFYAKYADKYKYLTSNIGMYISTNKQKRWTKKQLKVLPQLINQKGLIDGDDWSLVCGIFKAFGKEKYLTIGNFDNFDNTILTEKIIESNNKNIRKLDHGSYLFIDNVFVYPISDSSECKCFQNNQLIDDSEIDTINQESEFVGGTKLILPEISFKTNEANLSSAVFPFLDTLVLRLKASEDLNIVIEGHTDNTGDETANLKLSQKRADAVKNYLIMKGISKDRIKTEGKGSSVPVASNDTEEGMRKNRRVEVLLIRK